MDAEVVVMETTMKKRDKIDVDEVMIVVVVHIVQMLNVTKLLLSIQNWQWIQKANTCYQHGKKINIYEAS